MVPKTLMISAVVFTSVLFSGSVFGANPVAGDDSPRTAEDTAVDIAVLANDTGTNPASFTVTATPAGPSHGTVVIKPGGTIQYIPALNYTGMDSFTYTVRDADGNTDTGLVSVTVTPVNDAPVAVNDTARTSPGTPVAVSVLTNDFDIDGDTLTVAVATQGTHGTAVVGTDGRIVYTPAEATFMGSDSFTYTINDGKGGTATATVAVTVNSRPVAANDTPKAVTATAMDIVVLANDTDADGDTLTVTNTSVPPHGTAEIRANGIIRYTSEALYVGDDSFTYTISDGRGGSASATVTVTVAASMVTNAVDDLASTTEDSQVDINVLTNDPAYDAGSAVVTITTGPSHGTATVVGNAIRYLPANNYSGFDCVQYTLTDNNGNDTGWVRITVTADNDAPVAVDDDTAVTDEDTLAIIPVLDNDTDVDGNRLSVTAVTAPGHGTAVIDPTGKIRYRPALNYHGTDTFDYTVSDGNGKTDTGTVTVTINAVNDAPVAVGENFTTPQNTAITLTTLLSNDSDPDTGDGDMFSMTAVTSPQHGTAERTNNTVVYTPTNDYDGTDTFTYTITDGQGVTGTTTVLITVTPNMDPQAADDTLSISEDQAQIALIPVLSNDTYPAGLASSDPVKITMSASHGTAVVTSNNSIEYTPNANYHGMDGFTYTLEDSTGKKATASVSVTIKPVNDAPTAADDAAGTANGTPVDVAVLANDADADGDVLTVTTVSPCTFGTVQICDDSVVRYTPASGFSGTETFTYTAQDGHGGSASATVTITVAASTVLPNAVDDSATVDEDKNGGVTVTILANDTDPDHDTPTVSGVSQPGHGTVLLNADGTVTYTPASNYHGQDSFSYTISDHDGTDTATVNVTVNSVNDAPVAVDDTVTAAMDQAKFISVLANDTDVDGDTLTVTPTSPTAHGGTAVVQSDKSILYTPSPDYEGNDTFTYEIADGHGGTDTGTVTVVINAAPDAVNDTAQTSEITPVKISVLANDSDTNGDPLTVVAVNNGDHGLAVINSDNTITYTPKAGFRGTYSFTYTISDGRGKMDTATVTVTVTSIPVPLSVSLTYPRSPSQFYLGQGVPMVANVEGYSATGSRVEFYVGSNVIATKDPTAAQYVWNPTATGTYKLKAVAVNGDGATAQSAEVTVTVDTPPNVPPSVRITKPSNGTVFTVGQTISISAWGWDTDGSIGEIEFYEQAPGEADATKIAVVQANPATLDWSVAPAGSYTLTAKVKDAAGAVATSSGVNIVVNTLPTATADTATTVKDTPIDIDVLANDSDVDGDTYGLYAIAQAPRHGDATFKNGKIHYALEAGYVGTDDFTYTISDAHEGKSSAKVSITVTAVSSDSATIQITSPSAGSTFAAGSDIPITVGVQEQGKAIVRVEYYQGSTKLGTSTSSPFGFLWSKVAAGSYLLRAEATDSGGTVVTSGIVSITVTNAASSAPSVQITSPGDGSTFTAGDTVTIAASASDSDGTVASVDFYQGDTKLGSDTSAPFTFTWASVPAGVYSLTAKATDNSGNVTVSSTVNVTVNSPPNVSPTVTITGPAESAIFTAGQSVSIMGTALDADGSVAKVEIFQGNTKVGSSTSTPFSITWSNVPGGSYALYAKATDDDGDTGFSAPVNIFVNNLPTARDDTASTVEGTAVDINVLANDSDTDGEAVALESVGQAAHGLAMVADKKIRYTPDPGFFGSEQLMYTVQDTHGSKASAKVTITVKPILAPPTIQITSPANGAVFTIGDSVPLTVTAGVKSGTITKVEYIKGTAIIGTSTASPYGFTWSKPAAGSYMLTAKVTDSNGSTATSAPVTIVINTPPVAKDDVATTAKGLAVDLYVLGNDVDFDNDSLSVDTVVQPGHGAASIVDNKIRYTPDSHYFGTDQFAYTVKDGHGGQATASVTVNVTAAAKTFTVEITSPQRGATFTVGDDMVITAQVPDATVAISKVEFYQGTTLLGYDNSSPYQFTWTDVPAGNYSLTAKAIDTETRTSTSGSVSVKVEVGNGGTGPSGGSNGDGDPSDGTINDPIDGGSVGGPCPSIALIILSVIAASFMILQARNSCDD